MELLIIGAGAMGGLFGALLAPHAAVSLLTTNQEHAAVMGGHGLTLVDLDGATRRVPVRVLTDPQDYGRRADLVLVCTKTRATAQAAATARDLLAADGLALTLQNGLGNLEQLVAAVGAQRAAAGVTSQAATLLAPGRVRHAGSGPTVLGIPPGREEAITAVAGLFTRAGLETRISDDVDSLLWSKLIVNVGINALTALLRVPNGVLAQTPECDLLMARAVAEAVAVARALSIGLDGERQLERVREVCLRTADNRASMLQDILRGRPTEIDAINGAVVARGRAAGVDTPVNLLLTQLVQALEATVADRL
ncbi:2-dehydropantoate 2-reductase [uncultured Desulfobulbus sp.]|uniref:ketopantoate reductase family protein n=1 Tax=uncultured Desulfobulbus sp. TaxID=239745 RepID=UPI00260C5B41|nr:2-dehydropantoate 2-reductase [uncultured Desulfobulbus sp.]